MQSHFPGDELSDKQQGFADRTMVVSGASRGIGLAIALGAARRGSNVVLLAKTAEPHPRLPGTVHTAAAEIEAAGGKAVAVVGDVRSEEDVQRAVDIAVQRFGGVDICVNNASAISVDPTETLSAKKFDLMQQINIRGTFLLTKACLPHLRRSPNPHVLTIAPPMNMSPYWLDSAVEILSRPARSWTGRCDIDVEVLAEAGVNDLSKYGGGPHPIPDIFIDM
jgi:citronellol/citronellal dehydrogenase